MKLTIALLVFTLSAVASAKSLNCTASLSSSKLDNEKFAQALEWMQVNKVTDDSLVPKEFLSSPVAVETRTTKLDENGDASISGIIIEAYDKYGISYNFSAWAENGFIIYASAENEVIHNGSGVSKLKNQTSLQFESSSSEDGSSLELICTIE